MAGAPRTVAFGSFFEITDAGRDELITQFKSSLSDGISTPFIDYDESHHVFHCTSDDPRALNEFAIYFKTFIECEFKRAQAANRNVGDRDWTGSPRLIPLANTYLPDENDLRQNGLIDGAAERLVDFLNDSDESSEDTSGSDSIFAYWKPASGDINILTKDTAIAVANLTDCFLSIESAENHVKLTNGNVQQAQAKLKTLEPLMEQLNRHRTGLASPVDASFLLATSTLPGSGVRYVSAKTSPHCDRIVVDAQLEGDLEHMLLAEERIWTESGYEKPANPVPTATATQGPCTVWDGVTVPEIGPTSNTLPRKTSVDHTKAPSAVNGLNTNSNQHENSKFLLPREQARVTEWTKGIDPEGDPKALPDVPVEPEEADAKPGHQRLVVESDESDVEPSAVPSKAVESKAKAQPGRLEEKANPRIRRRDRTNVAPARQPHAAMDQASTEKAKEVDPNFFAAFPRDDDVKEAAHSGGTTRRDGLSKALLGPNPTNTMTTGSASAFTQLVQSGAENVLEEPQTSMVDENSTWENPRQFAGGLESVTPTKRRPGAYQKDFMKKDSDDERQSFGQLSSQESTASKSGSRPLHNSAITKNKSAQPDDKSTRASVSFDISAPEAHSRGHAGRMPTPAHPRPSTVRQYFAGNEHAHQQSSPRPSEDLLIDLDEADQRDTVMRPPPGLEHNPSRSLKLDIMDAPLENIQRPSLKPASPLLDRGQDLSSTTSTSSGARPLAHEYKVISHVPKANIAGMRRKMIGKLNSGRSGQAPSALTSANIALSTERIAEDDESLTRVYRQAMNLKASNPGKGKRKNKSPRPSGPSQQMKPADRLAKIEEALRDPDAPLAGQSRTRQPAQPSQRILQAAKTNSELASLHATSLQRKDRETQAIEFRKQLGSIFDIARAFAGKVSFSMQFGQVLVPENAKIRTRKVYEKDKWEARFKSQPQGPGPVPVKFSKTLTDNGADMDRLLDCKVDSYKMWDKKPTMTSFKVEFYCQTQSGSGLKLVMNSEGEISVGHEVKTIGTIAFSCPGCVWDGCAIVEGEHATNQTSDEIEEAVKQLRETLYLEPSLKTTLFFRQPANGAFNVKRVRLQRSSLHKCQVKGETELYLKLVENKELLLQCHKEDKHLWKAFEQDHIEMSDEGRVYYEAGIVHESIDDALEENQTLEIGELTSQETTGISLLPHPKTKERSAPTEHRALVLLEAMIRVIDRIDWMGARNTGTLRRLAVAQEEFEQNIAASSRHPLQSIAARGPLGKGTIGGSTRRPGTIMMHDRTASMQSTLNRQPVHGVRTGTKAQRFVGTDGNEYLFGQGGARIPLTEDETATSRDVMPDDSASQVGGSRTVRVRMPGVSEPQNRSGASFW